MVGRNEPVRRCLGGLAVHVWPAARPAAPAVVAAHGITANGLSWARVADQLAGTATLIAPDLRGRAGSREAGGPYGIAVHAADLVAILDGLGVERAVVAGHSMGAYVAAAAAAARPDRFGAAVLVDGGLSFGVPVTADIDAALTSVIGPAMQRLSMTFPSRAAYRDYWRAHPAFAAMWSPWVDEYIQYDLVGTEPELRSSCVLDAVRVDGTGVLADPDVHAAIHQLTVPATLLWAERGVLDQPGGLYTAERIAAANLARVSTVEVPDTNHYSILCADPGAAAVAAHLRAGAGQL